MKDLTGRIERLEALRPQAIRRTHRVIQEVGEAQSVAVARYQQASGTTIALDDLVILRVIVSPLHEAAA